MSPLLWLVTPTYATDVVWIGEASQEDIERVRRAAGASGPPIKPEQFVDSAAASGPADDDAYLALEKTLERVRGLEDRLDGEVIIMHDLEAAISDIPVVRNDRDRDRVYGALTYEGFAVNRYFADDLGTEEAAAPYRHVFGSTVLVAAWVDAAAMAPEREVTPYEIAQAPHRAAFRSVQEQLVGLARATLDVHETPDGAILYLDGQKALVGNDRTIAVVPGRHWIHAVRRDTIAARWTVDVEPGVTEVLRWPDTDAAWNALVAGLGTLVATPPGLGDALDRNGGEVWVARAAPRAVAVWRVTETTITPVALARQKPVAERPPSNDTVTLSVGGGWFYSPDFYLEDPLNTDRTVGSVNAGALAIGATWRHGFGPMRLGAGVDVLDTLGDAHAAFYGGDQTTALRPHPFVLVGYEQIAVTGGFLFPHHLAVGARGAWTVAGPISLTAHGVLGIGLDQERVDAEDFEPERIATAWVTVDWNSR
jgi:hypothetical protein